MSGSGIGADAIWQKPIATKVWRTVFPFTGLRLLLPAILPSWRFFDAVTASPRVDYTLLTDDDECARCWQEFRPRPAMLHPGTMLRRLLWNPQWNEDLFLVSLAERLMSTASAPDTVAHSERELLLRVARHLDRNTAGNSHLWLQIRLRFVGRASAEGSVVSDIAYLSTPRRITDVMKP
jgi:hypothetical protein